MLLGPRILLAVPLGVKQQSYRTAKSSAYVRLHHKLLQQPDLKSRVVPIRTTFRKL